MEAPSNLTPKIVPPGGGKTLRAFGDEITVHLGGEETGGKFAMFTTVTQAGLGPPPHYQMNEDEWFLPLEGRVEFFLNGSWNEVPMGTIVFIPKGTVHTFRNAGQGLLKMLVHTAPSGFEIFFSRCAAEFAKPGAPDMKRLIEISAEHGIFFVNV